MPGILIRESFSFGRVHFESAAAPYIAGFCGFMWPKVWPKCNKW